MYRWAHFGLGWSDVILRSLLFQTKSIAYWFSVLRNMTQFIIEVYSKCTYQKHYPDRNYISDIDQTAFPWCTSG